MTTLRILFVYNWVPDEERTEAFRECASTKTVQRLTSVFQSYQMEVIPLNLFSKEQLTEAVQVNQPDLAFVIAEGFLDEPETLYDGSGALSIRAVLEGLGVPYSHSDVQAMEACRNKDITYEKLGQKEIAIPRFFVFSEIQDDNDNMDRVEYVVGYPMFLKPCGGGCSIGIDEKSIVRNRSELLSKLQQLREMIGDQPILAETYLPGREYTVGVIGNGVLNVLPVIAFPEAFNVRSQEVKMVEHQSRSEFEIIPVASPVGAKIKDTAMQVFQALGARDLIRLDLREGEDGRVYVIDVNGTPSLSLTGSLAFMAENSAVDYPEFIAYFLFVTLTRYGLPINDQLNENAVRVNTYLQGIFENQIA
ncbi:D-alanine--D-alanine ligase family protein [Alkalihalobacterium chitinilyticum]|uniref:ATP-grasp domain-containing protein n=1 Tax=Alkalihalobacterium chitinilyticum TaxID=2980103 RepID=A0ABT5VJN6_9BACI|nr:ATP-grasp domain-containing protein [Alkalihalobacterium chitinilyticum]MDE5415411.1 ATP-grasp domain-containing protein [Alkalihalobacterium chitinilyticum]